MNHLNDTQKQYLSETVQKLSGAMKKIKFTQKMSSEEAEAIRKELNSVQGTLAVFSDINPDIQQIELFKETADLSQEALRVLTGSHDHFGLTPPAARPIPRSNLFTKLEYPT